MSDSASDPAFEAILETVLTSRDNGDPVDVNGYLERYPEHADKLRRFLQTLEVVDSHIRESRITQVRFGLSDHSAAKRQDGEVIPTGRSSAPELPTLGGFRILEEIGSGSQGVVYKAEQPGTRRVVALKVIREGVLASGRERLRFENEIQVASQLKHPNIAAVFESGCDHGREFFAMEYADGDPLDVYLATHTLTPDETVRLFQPICDAVSYAHRQGVIHRDLKPSNIIVDDAGIAHILDFGLAKRLSRPSEVEITQVGSFAGTWYYASPEQVAADGREIDVRSDVYSLSVILYEALTDAFPYPIRGVTHDQIAFQILEAAPIRPSLIRKEINDELDTIVLQSLQKDPNRRYQSASALQEDLRRFLAGEAIEAKRDSRWYVLRKTLRRYYWQACAATIALVVLLAFTVTVTVLYADARTARATAEARAELARRGQRYVVDRLAELHGLRNALSSVENEQGRDVTLERLSRPAISVPAELASELVQDFPPNIVAAVNSRTNAEFNSAAHWLRERSAGLDQLQTLTESGRFVFETGRDTSAWLFQERPSDLGQGQKLCDALVADSVLESGDGDDTQAMRRLTAARSIGMDLADGPTFLHKGVALICRLHTYGAILTMLASSRDDARRVEGCARWILNDPPLPTLQYAMITEGTKALQLIEASIRETMPGGKGHVDLDTLNAVTEGLYEAAGMLTPENRRRANLLSPEVLMHAIDRYADELDARAIAQASVTGPASVRSRGDSEVDEAAWLIAPLLPRLEPGLRTRARVNATRSAAQMAAVLCRFRARTGAWPDSLAHVLDDGSDLPPGLSSAASEFAYRVVDDQPILSALGDDPANANRRNKDWSGSEAEVVLFRGEAPQAH
ncbi:MAG: serine/threonine-protein kinase [Planctomycetota bacterium]